MTTAGSGAQQGNASASASAAEKKSINTELWQTCAGPLVNLLSPGTHVVYFPQGHSEQVAASMKKDVDAQIPNYPNLPSKLLCILHNITLHADPETDEVYAQMTLQPVNSFDKEDLLRSDLSMRVTKPQTEFFCKTLTASDTSTHGGFSVPRRAAEKIFPQLDFTMQPPAQELMAKDLHDNTWTFRHIYRGQPKRHLLTTGWSHFVSGKRLFAGDSVLFIRDVKQQLLLGIRRANRQPTNLSSSVLSSDSMHIGILAAAAHAAANNSPFTVFYNPRASPSEFVIPLAKYYKAVCNNHISSGMRFRMLFETEESGTRRYMGTITGVSDLDPVRWKNSQWRNLQVGWDESIAGEKRNRVSIWEIEPVTAPFFLCPTPPIFGLKRPRLPGMPDDGSLDLDNLYRRNMPWLGDEFGLKDTHAMPGLSLAQWMNMKQNPSLTNSMQPNFMSSLPGSVLPDLVGADISRQLGLHSVQMPQQNNLQFGNQRPKQAVQQLDQLQKLPSFTENSVGSIVQPLQQLTDITQPARHNTGQTLPTTQVQPPVLQQQCHVPTQNVLPQQPSLLNHQLQSNLSQNLPQQQQQPYHQPVLSHPQQHNLMPSQSPDHWPVHVTADQLQLQLLKKIHQQQQSQLAQLSAGSQQPSQVSQLQHQQKQLLDTTASNLPKSASASQMLDASQATLSVHPQPHVTQQMTRTISQSNLRIAQLPQQQQLKSGIVSEFPGHVSHTLNPTNNQPSAGGSSLLTGAAGGGQSPVSDDAPSCSTSPSTNNCQNVILSTVNDRSQQTTRRDGNHGIAWSSTPLLNVTGLESMSSSAHLVKDLIQKPDVHSQNQNSFGSQAYHNGTGAKTDYVDSSSGTSVLSQNDVHQLLPVNNSMFLNPMLFRDASQDGEVQDDPRSSVPFGATVDNQFGMPMLPESMINRKMETDVSCGGGMVSGYQNPKDAQPGFSSAVVPQSFGVPDMTFNSIDPTIDGGFMNTEAWAGPQIPRMRTYTKVYKRGAVGRSIDITRYSGYDELKQDLARRFGIEGQLEDRQKIGWKLVYVDHENDVLLVGDDPWEEFVNCVRCIKILSPQEVQQMSLDGDFGGSILPTSQTCGSSDNGLS